MTPEGKVKQKLKATLTKLAPHVWFYMPVSTGYGKHGVPDFLISLCGRFMAIETKAKGGKPTSLQELQLTLLSKSGAIVAVVDETNVDVFCDNIKVFVCQKQSGAAPTSAVSGTDAAS